MKWYKGAPPMDGRRYLLCFKGSTDSDDIICTGSYRYARPYNEPAPNTKAWRCDCCGKFSDPYYWAEIPKRALPGRFRDGEQLQVERAEAVKESLTSALKEISGFSAYWKCLRGNEEAWENVWNIATDALISLRTAEESSAVGLIDSTLAKQFQNAENADEDGVVVIDIEASLHAQTEAMKRLLESQPLSPELAALGRELVRLAELAEKSLGEVTE